MRSVLRLVRFLSVLIAAFVWVKAVLIRFLAYLRADCDVKISLSSSFDFYFYFNSLNFHPHRFPQQGASAGGDLPARTHRSSIDPLCTANGRPGTEELRGRRKAA